MKMNINLPLEISGLLPERAESLLPVKRKDTVRRITAFRNALSVFLAFCGGFTLLGLLLSSAGSLSEDLPRKILEPVFAYSLDTKAPDGTDSPPPPPISEHPVDTEVPVPDNNINDDIYHFDSEAVPEGEKPIVPTDLSTVFATESVFLSNFTSLSPDTASLFTAEYPLPPAARLGNEEGEPIVLIIHTHGTEAYSEENSVSYSDTSNVPRSTDTTENVVAVGRIMSEVFTERGIPNIHCKIMHDEESYKDSYSRSAETIKKYLELYPSIKYVFDVHRDSIVKENGEKIRPIFSCNGETVAQVMSVVGTNELGANFPDWEKNLNLALKLHTLTEEKYGAMSRPINLRGAAFNQHYSEISLLLEVGSCGNTLAEAKKAGALLADSLSDLIIKGNG
ncbi:MAG: stage II sporulation protein P [Clostridia bacterium]|nr:stage II sporulation protein P [Clostridia bacterium]